MERSDKDTAKAMDSTDVSKPAKTSKFKFNKPTSRLQLQTNNTNENRSLNIIGNQTSGLGTVKKFDCVVISDEEHSPIKGTTAAKKVTAPSALNDDGDDLFKDFKSNDLTFMKESTSTKNAAKTMEDLYAKYGTPKASEKSEFDSLDIDKALNSNASYVNAMKKLDENMERLKTSPKKPATTSKFKFNSRSKPNSASNQNTSQISNSSNFSTNTSFESTATSFASSITATVTSGAYSSSVSNSLSSSTTNLTAKSTANTVNRFSPVTTTTNTTSQNSATSTNSYRAEPPAPISPVDISFKSNESP